MINEQHVEIIAEVLSRNKAISEPKYWAYRIQTALNGELCRFCDDYHESDNIPDQCQ